MAPLLEAVLPNYGFSNCMSKTGESSTLNPLMSNEQRISKVYVPSEGKGSLKRCRKVTWVSQLTDGAVTI